MKLYFSFTNILLIAALVIGVHFSGHAADTGYLNRSDRLNGWKTRMAFEGLYREHRTSVVEILENGHQIGLGTVVASDGYIVAKASEFGESLEVRLHDYIKHVPELVSVDETNDFALLKINAKGLKPVQWYDASRAKMGQWVLSPHEDETQVRLGVISATARQINQQPGALGVVVVNGDDYLMEEDLIDWSGFAASINEGTRPIDKWLKGKLSRNPDSALQKFLENGEDKAALQEALLRNLNRVIFGDSIYDDDRFEAVSLSPETKEAMSDDGFDSPHLNRLLLGDCYLNQLAKGQKGGRIVGVIEGSAAEKAGLQSDDHILSVGNVPVTGSRDVTRIIKTHKAGETISLVFSRDGGQLEKKVTLGYFDTTFPDQDVNIELSGDISDRRTGFESILQHDIPLPPKAMGGPLMTLEGQVIGINIARFDRVATFALPSSLVQELIEKLK